MWGWLIGYLLIVLLLVSILCRGNRCLCFVCLLEFDCLVIVASVCWDLWFGACGY